MTMPQETLLHKNSQGQIEKSEDDLYKSVISKKIYK